MARLRTIDGVTRVSLAKSDKEATAGRHRRATAARPRATGFCGKAGVPAFELVVFFEGAAAASTAPAPGATAAGDREHDRRQRPPPAPPLPRQRLPQARPGARRRRSRGDAERAATTTSRLDHPLGADTVTKNKTLLIAVVATAAAIAAFWFLALAPKREEATALEGKIADQADRARRRRSRRSPTTSKAKVGYGKNYATVVRLGKAVPDDDDVRSLLVQLDAEAGGTDVDFRTIQVGGTSAPSGATRDRRHDGHAAAPGRGRRRHRRLLRHAVHVLLQAGPSPTSRSSSPAWSAS